MPFVDGVPCSIHGIVLPDGVAVLRPVEMVVLRRILDDGSREFFYAGCATFWDPADDVRTQMVDVARRVGEQLRAEVDFKGTFTVDGVAAPDGFWPTELNPRFGAGINTIARAGGDVPILLINEVAGSGLPLGISATDLERELVPVADANRGGGTWKPGLRSPVAVDDRPAVFESGRWRWATDDDDRAVIAGMRHGRGGHRALSLRARPDAGRPVDRGTGGRFLELRGRRVRHPDRRPLPRRSRLRRRFVRRDQRAATVHHVYEPDRTIDIGPVTLAVDDRGAGRRPRSCCCTGSPEGASTSRT